MYLTIVLDLCLEVFMMFRYVYRNKFDAYPCVSYFCPCVYVLTLDVWLASANDRCVEGRLHIAPVCDPLIQSVIRSVIPRSRDPVWDPVCGGGLCDLVCASSFPPPQPQHAKERCCTSQKGRSRRKKEYSRSSHGDSGGALT